MRKLLFPIGCLLVSAFFQPLFSQEAAQSPRNHIGAFAGIEWNSISGLTAITFERTLLMENRISVGVKGVYAFSYQNGNMKILGGSYDGSSSFAGVLPSIRLDTKEDKGQQQGFYMQTTLGAIRRTYYDGQLAKIKPGFEMGFGWHFPIGNRVNLQWSNSILFAGVGGITQTRLAIGF